MKIVRKVSPTISIILRRTAAGGPTKDLPDPASDRTCALPGDSSLAALAQNDSDALLSSTFMVRGAPTAHDDCERSEAIPRLSLVGILMGGPIPDFPNGLRGACLTERAPIANVKIPRNWGWVFGSVELHATRDGAWRSLVAHLPWAQVVGGSNPLAPTITRPGP